MARITPIDVIKGISGKYGSGSNDYFATNPSSNRIHLAKYLNKPTGPATELQLAQMQDFATQQKMAAAGLRTNRSSEENAPNGTEAYQGGAGSQEVLTSEKRPSDCAQVHGRGGQCQRSFCLYICSRHTYFMNRDRGTATSFFEFHEPII